MDKLETRKILFNDNWNFKKESLDNNYISNWEGIDVPHDWLIYDVKNLYENSIGYYKKTFIINDLKDKNYSLYFEGIYMDSKVYVNDFYVGEWKYGYSSFEFNITKFLELGENEVNVKVVHKAPNSRWYSGAGIYRNVWLIKTSMNHLITDGIYISTRKESDGWYVDVETEVNIKNDATLKHSIMEIKKDNSKTIKTETITVPKSETLINKLKQSLFIKSPMLWNIENPQLYKLKTELIVNNKVVDEIISKFGFRTIKFDNNKGFFLNEKYIKLHGVCEHHDLGALGAAVNKTAIRRRLNILKEMGINSIRTAHNMPAVEFMELVDEMGFLIISEGFDMWELCKTEYDYGRFFKDWHEKDVCSWIKRDRNHPSIIMWSIGNEIYDTHTSLKGVEITKTLMNLVRLYDPRENALITIGSNYMAWENAQKCADEIQVVGYNYAEHLYNEHHKKYPHWIIYGSENASTVQSRGVYHFPANISSLTHDDEQCSSLGNCITGWGSKSTQKNIIDDRDTSFCLGQFVWTGFDYIGEPTPYFTKNSYLGQIDTAGFKKDSFYLYQAEWTDYKINPMIHILPWWDFNEGQLIDIRIYSNAPKTELFFNDKSYGIYEIDHKNGKQLSGIWQLPYQKGTIKAVAYDENDVIIATDEQHSFSDAKKIIMTADKTELMANGQDLIFIEINALDHNNNFVSNANNRIFIDVDGEGRLLGLDNGDSTDYDQYKGNNKKMFNGRLIAIIAAKLTPGNIKVKAYSPGLEISEIDLISKVSNFQSGISATSEILCEVDYYDNAKVPVRKIELTNNGINSLNKSINYTNVSAKLYPENTSYNELNWSATTPGGTETNIAKVEETGNEAIVTAIGDGSFRLRCSCNNGSSKPVVISELEF
ncbi:MAG: glycoside hydrolase family 2 TIM barrel-domain containing protein, partial [Clostridiales bacterium]